MKKILLLLSLFAFSVCQSQDWKLLLESKEGTYYYKPNSNNTAWIKLVSDKTIYYSKMIENPKTVDGYTVILYAFDCNSKRMGTIKLTVYSKDKEVLDVYSEDETDVRLKMDNADPDSTGEKFLLLL